MKNFLFSIVFLLTGFTLYAQTTDDLIELVKSDIKTNSKAIITQEMNFTSAESEIFWPIYREYEHEKDKLSDKRVATIKEFAANYDSLTNKKADELMKSTFSFMEDRLALNKKYYKKFAEALSPTLAAKFMQLENELQLVIDLNIVSMLPYVKKSEMK